MDTYIRYYSAIVLARRLDGGSSNSAAKSPLWSRYRVSSRRKRDSGVKSEVFTEVDQ